MITSNFYTLNVVGVVRGGRNVITVISAKDLPTFTSRQVDLFFPAGSWIIWLQLVSEACLLITVQHHTSVSGEDQVGGWWCQVTTTSTWWRGKPFSLGNGGGSAPHLCLYSIHQCQNHQACTKTSNFFIQQFILLVIVLHGIALLDLWWGKPPVCHSSGHSILLWLSISLLLVTKNPNFLAPQLVSYLCPFNSSACYWSIYIVCLYSF